MTTLDHLDKFIRLYDPAIDWSVPGGTPNTWPAKRDAESLKLKPGKTPIVFHCARLTRDQYSWVMAAPSATERAARAFRAAVRRVDRLTGPWFPAGVDRREYTGMTDDELALYGFVDHDEIGGLIVERSALPTDCEVGFEVQPSSLRVWVAQQRTSLSAAQNQATPPATSSAPAGSASAAPAKTVASRVSTSGARTDATAKAKSGRPDARRGRRTA